MTRNLKALVAAALAVTAFGAFGAASAQAVDGDFHCSVEPCRYTLKKDGTGSTAHHVFVIKNSKGTSVSLTCTERLGYATSISKTADQLTVTGIELKGCNVQGAPLNTRMNGCSYLFDSDGNGTATGATVLIECEASTSIEYEIPETGCIFTVAGQDLWGIGYHNIGSAPNREVTLTTKVPNIQVGVKAVGAGCFLDVSTPPLIAEISTGNSILAAETHATALMADGWWE